MTAKPRGGASISTIGPRPQSEWIGGIEAAPFLVGPRGAAKRPLVVLWVELPEGFVVGADVAEADDAAGVLGRTLQAAMAQPKIGSPRRPGRIRVASQEMAEELRDLLGEGFPIVVAPTPELEEPFTALEASMEKAGDADYEVDTWLGDGLVEPKTVADLHQIAAAFYRLAPWRGVSDDQPIRVDIPALDVEGACLIIFGGMGESFGFAIFPSLAGYERFVAAADQFEKRKRRPDLGTGYLALNFEPGAEQADAMRREVAGHGWPVAGADAYPRVYRRERDGFPLPLEDRDVKIVSATASAFAAFFIRHGKLFSQDFIEPVCESCYDSDDLEVIFCVPYEAYADFTVDGELPGRAGRNELPKPGRNAPCHCGSGRKYKHCCLSRDRTAAAEKSGPSVGESLVSKLTHFAEDRFGDAWHRHEQVFVDPQDSMQLCGPWSLYGFEVEGATVADHYLKARGGKLSTAERALLEAERAGWLSIWEAMAVEPGAGLTLRDLLTEETRQVTERAASRALVRYDVILARVIDYEGGSVLSALHPRLLPPAHGAEVLRVALGRLRRRRAVRVERLRDSKFGEFLIRRWEREVATVDAFRTRPIQLNNMDGDPFEIVRDRFAIKPGSAAEVRARLASLPDVDLPEGSKGPIVFMQPSGPAGSQRAPILVGRGVITGEVLTLDTNSASRADALRKRIETACRFLIAHEARETQDLPPLASDDDARKGLRAVPDLDDQEVALEFKRRHYATWPDHPLPALRGKTPRQAARTAQGRRDLDTLLKYPENMELRAEGEAGFDFRALRRELGLE
ncbi:hypothetical protein FJ251_08260 [bacterium]|nr:hypothetical protein [bacterium]